MQKKENIEDFMERYDKWWTKWHRMLIAGATMGIILDVIGLYFLLTSDLTSAFFFRYLLALCLGVLVGFSTILFFAANPKLRRRTVKYAVSRNYSKT